MLLMMVSLGLMLPKIWKVSPAGYQPVSKISGLDFLQAWSFKRQALEQAAEARFDLAVSSWNACIANRPFHASVLRQALNTFRYLKSPEWRYVWQVRLYGKMLLALDETEASDQKRVAETLLAMGAVSEAATVIDPAVDQVDSELLPFFSLLNLLDNREIRLDWIESLQAQAQQGDLNSREVMVVHGLLQSSGSNGIPFDSFLEEQGGAFSKPDAMSELMLHLGFQLACKIADDQRVNQLIAELRARELLRTWHLLKKWRLQIANGGQVRVLSEIRHEKALPLLNPDQVLELAGLYLDLNQSVDCQDMLETWLKAFPSASSLWVLQGELLLKSGDWDRIRAFAGRIRTEPSLAGLTGYAWFLEAEGFRRDGHSAQAENAFKNWEESPVSMPTLDLRMARHARDVGLVDLALRRFRILEAHFENHEAFWRELFEFAHHQGQIQFLLRAAQKLHALAPRSPMHANNYAAVMLALRQNPSEAIGMTLSLVQQFPSDWISRINHIHALLQNQRVQDAESLLATMDRSSLSDDHQPAYDLAVFELHCLQSRFKEAGNILESMKIEKLLPPQQMWVKDMVDQLGLTMESRLSTPSLIDH